MSTARRKNPKLWEASKKKAIAKMGGKFSARAMQHAIKLYKAAGGKYIGRKRADNDLKKWTAEDWGYVGEKKKSRYLPKKARSALTRGEKAATSRAKNKGTKKGKQWVKQPARIAKKVAKYHLFLLSFLIGLIIGVPPLFVGADSPGGITADLELWLRADTGVTDSSGTLTGWTDQTGNNTFTVFGDPQTGNSTLNNNNVIEFDGSGDYLDGTSTIDMRHAFLVLDNTSGSGAALGPKEEFSGSTKGYFFREINDSGTNKIFMGDIDATPTYLKTTSAAPTGYVLIHTEKKGGSSATDSRIAVDGADQGVALHSGSGGVAQHTSTPRIARGSDPNNFAEFTGNIAEIIVYGGSGLSAASINRVESYLAIKYGITLDSGEDYVDSNGSSVFDSDGTHSSYTNDIAGIGQDDESSLNQATSTSINSDAIVTMGSASSQGDGDFLIWGNDNGATTEASSNRPTGVGKRLTRVWRVDETNTMGSVTLQFDLTGLSITGTTTDAFTLIVDSDTTFSSGAATSSASSFSSDVVTFSGVDFSDGDYFTLGTSINNADGSPGGVSDDLELWLKADAGIDESDGGSVDQWNDQSGNGNNGTQSTAANRPTFEDDTTNSINNNPVVDFDGSNDSLDLGNLSALKGGSDYTLYAVGIREDANENYVIGSAGGTTGEDLHLGYRSSTQIRFSTWSNDLDVTVDAYDAAASTPYMLFGEFDGGTGRTAAETKDGDEDSGTDSHTTGLSGSKTNHVGFLGNANYYYNGRIAEVIAYGDDLTDSEEDQVESYLAIKYGITRDQSTTTNSYVDSSGTTVWDAVTNASYNDDIAGIGRDDNSGLNQSTSTSQHVDALVTIGSPSSLGSGEFLIWGNDNGSTSTLETSDVPNAYSVRVTREWRVDMAGDVGEVILEFDISDLAIPQTGRAADYALLIDSDGTFSNANAHTNGVNWDDGVVQFTNVDFSDGDYFTLAYADAVDTSLGGVFSGLKLWLDADDDETLHTDDACTSATPAADANVECWEDKSGLGAHVTEIPGDCNEGSGGTQTCGVPQYRTNEFNGRPALEFFRSESDALRYDLNGNGEQWTGTNFTVFIVFEQQGTPAEFYSFFSNGNPPGSDHFQIDSDASGNFAINTGGGRATFEAFDNSLKLYALSANSTTFTTYVDGESQNTLSYGSSRIFEHYRINQNRNGNQLNDAKIAEIIIYDRELSNCEFSNMYQYLGEKYGRDFGGGTPGGVDCENVFSWWKADAGVNLSGSDVTSWEDQGVNDNDASQTTGSQRPDFTDDVFNFNPAIRFDGSDDKLTTTSDIGEDVTEHMTIFSLYQPHADNAGAPWGNDNGGWDRFIIDVSASINNAVSTGSGGTPANFLNNVTDLFSTLIPTLATLQYDEDESGGSFVHVNGSTTASFTSGQGPQTDSNFSIGWDGDDNNFDGDVSEVIIYDTLLNDSERQRIESYLAIKYGVSLDPIKDYVDSDGTVLYHSSTTHSSYTNDIAGIGRDDAQSLTQEESRSENTDSIIIVSTSTALDNGDFLLWGNDNGTTTEVTTNLPADVSKRLGRIWRIDETNEVGTTTVSFDLSGLTVTGSAASDFALITDSDATFTSGAATTAAATYASNVVTFTGVNFADGEYVALGTATGTSLAPGGVTSNMQLWLKADAEVTGTSEVSVWGDSSSNDNDFIQSTATNRPAKTDDAINFNPALTFDGVDNFMEDADGENYIEGNSSITTFTVIDADSANHDGYIFITSNDATLTEAPWSLRFDDSGAESSRDNTLKTGINAGSSDELYEADADNLAKSTPMIAGVGWQSGSAPVFYTDSVSTDSYASPLQSGTLTDADYVRLGDDGNQEFWDGHIAEVVLYDTLVSSTSRARIESYFALKYGITLDQTTATDYVASDGSTEMWDKDASGASTYDNDIAGIGRDDASGLGQIKSQSSNSDGIVIVEAADEGTNAANSFVDIDDFEFMAWGNDSGATTQTASNTPDGISKRLERIWQLQEVGEVGSTTVSFDLTGLTVDGTQASDFTLIIDTDTTFSSGATTTTATSYSTSTNIVSFPVEESAFENGVYFALGTFKGTLSVDIVNASSTSVSNPSVAFTTISPSFSSQTTTGTLGTTSEKIRIDNGTGSGAWSLSIAAASTTSVWSATSSTYDFNDPTVSAGDGGDADSVGGQLTIDASGATLSPDTGCTSTGITLGSSNSFSEGVTDSITIVTANSSADTACIWDITDVSLSQTIPADQSAESYTIDLTLTIVAS